MAAARRPHGLMSTRARNRMKSLGRAALTALSPAPRTRPHNPRSILVLHELLLGDTLMLAALFARLRALYPQATIFTTVKPEILPLFSGRPYGVAPLAYSERSTDAFETLRRAKDADLAFVPGENRDALTARGVGAGWVVAFSQARPAWKNWTPDELVDFPSRSTNLADIFASLAGGEPIGLRYRKGDWPAPEHDPFETPKRPYAVLHIGARSPLRYWPSPRWSELAERLAERYEVVWSTGPREGQLVDEVDPQRRFRAYPGTLDLAQLWHLVAGADLLVTLDTGVAHLAKLTFTRTLCLFGPGSAPLLGRGEFFADAPFTEVTVPDFPCRDRSQLFKREVAWVRHCARTLDECPQARCMEALSVEDVLRSIPA
jgi:ADP-heptose:LPS heptosyltransferase